MLWSKQLGLILLGVMKLPLMENFEFKKIGDDGRGVPTKDFMDRSFYLFSAFNWFLFKIYFSRRIALYFLQKIIIPFSQKMVETKLDDFEEELQMSQQMMIMLKTPWKKFKQSTEKIGRSAWYWARL